MKRYLNERIRLDLERKMILLSGPRQVGKTVLAKALMAEFKSPQYLNFDNPEDALIIQRRSWAANADFLILDEIHKMRVMRMLVELLRKRVGSPLSCASLAGDLKIAPNTVRSYIDI